MSAQSGAEFSIGARSPAEKSLPLGQRVRTSIPGKPGTLAPTPLDKLEYLYYTNSAGRLTWASLVTSPSPRPPTFDNSLRSLRSLHSFACSRPRLARPNARLLLCPADSSSTAKTPRTPPKRTVHKKTRSDLARGGGHTWWRRLADTERGCTGRLAV